MSDEDEEYDVGFEETGANELEVLEMEAAIAVETVDSQMNLDQDPLDGECIRNLFSGKDYGHRGDENIDENNDENMEIETLDDTGASATSVKDEKLNLAMLDVSLDNNETNESNSSDCMTTAMYYAYFERDEADAN